MDEDEDYLPTEDPKPDNDDFNITVSRREYTTLIKEQQKFEARERQDRLKRAWEGGGADRSSTMLR